MDSKEGVKKIIPYLPIDNYFAEYRGRTKPVIVYLLVILAPVMVYGLLLLRYIPFKLFLIAEVLWAIRMGLYILGDEDNRYKSYLSDLEDEYASSKDLIRINHLHPDGLVEYSSGVVAYYIMFRTNQNLDDKKYADGLSDFFNLFKDYEKDIYGQMSIDEYPNEADLSGLSIYSDLEIKKERMDILLLQDEYCRDKSLVFNYVMVVKASKYNWKEMQEVVDDALKSDHISQFKEIKKASTVEEVSELLSRDLTIRVSISEMLREKYNSEDYDGARVLYIGDKKDYIKNESDLDKRRVRLDAKR